MAHSVDSEIDAQQALAPADLKGLSSRSVHAGEIRYKSQHALADPIFQTSTYTFENMADACAYQQAHLKSHVADRFEYGRYGNPTIAAAEARLAALENAGASILVASGMAAITDTFIHFLPGGSHIVLTDDSYRRTRQFCEKLLNRYGVDCTVVALNDFDALEAAIRPETKLLFSETPTNPFVQILDLQRFAEIGRRRQVITVVDATFSTPINTRPLDWGIDLVLHSATKYLGGHNDLLAGFIAGRSALIDPLRETIGLLGGISDPNTAYLLLRGMKTLKLRVDQQNRSAQQIAEFLFTHPAVESVWYPGLESHPGHALAVRQMSGFGGVVSLAIRGDLQATFRFIDALRTFYISPSLGGTESLLLHPASMAYPDCTPAERLELKMTDNLVRLAIGIEDAGDLIADLKQALQAV
jgi:cystathionine gamma-synthase